MIGILPQHLNTMIQMLAQGLRIISPLGRARSAVVLMRGFPEEIDAVQLVVYVYAADVDVFANDGWEAHGVQGHAGFDYVFGCYSHDAD